VKSCPRSLKVLVTRHCPFLRATAAAKTLAHSKIGFDLRPQQDSNLRRRLRRPYAVTLPQPSDLQKHPAGECVSWCSIAALSRAADSCCPAQGVPDRAQPRTRASAGCAAPRRGPGPPGPRPWQRQQCQRCSLIRPHADPDHRVSDQPFHGLGAFFHHGSERNLKTSAPLRQWTDDPLWTRSSAMAVVPQFISISRWRLLGSFVLAVTVSASLIWQPRN
jgi:hypothetical protein